MNPETFCKFISRFLRTVLDYKKDLSTYKETQEIFAILEEKLHEVINLVLAEDPKNLRCPVCDRELFIFEDNKIKQVPYQKFQETRTKNYLTPKYNNSAICRGCLLPTGESICLK